MISRHHCVLLIEDGYIGVRDFGSKNGTYVNQERVVGERELKAGDRLTVGPLQFEIHVAHGLAKKRPPVHDIKEAVTRTASDTSKGGLDVNEWLAGEPDTETKSPGTVDTAGASLTDTDSIDLANTQTMTPEQSEEETHAEHAKGPREKRPPGKLPPIPGGTKDSQHAAANMLNKFRQRR